MTGVFATSGGHYRQYGIRISEEHNVPGQLAHNFGAIHFSVNKFPCLSFQYLTNNINSNGCTLVKVIAAVLKFSPQQTQVVLEREAQRKTLVSSV